MGFASPSSGRPIDGEVGKRASKPNFSSAVQPTLKHSWRLGAFAGGRYITHTATDKAGIML